MKVNFNVRRIDAIMRLLGGILIALTVVGSLARVTHAQGSPAGEHVLIADNFDDNSLATVWTANALATGHVDASIIVAEANHHIEIGPLKQNDSGAMYNGLRSTSSFAFAGGTASAQLVQAPNSAATGAYAMFAVAANDNNFYRWYVSDGAMVAEEKIGGTKTSLLTIPYNPTNHQYMRIRHDVASNAIVFETAPAGSNGGPDQWTSQFSKTWNTGAVPLNALVIELKAGTTGLQSVAPGTVAFDNVRATVPIAETVVLSDQFASSSLDTTKWSRAVLSGAQDTTVNVTATGSDILIGPLKQGVPSSHYNGILSVNTIDLTGAYVYAQIVSVPDTNGGAYTMLTLPMDDANHYRIYESGNVLSFETKVANVKSTIKSLVFKPDQHGFWRIRHDAETDQIAFETAPSIGGAPGVWTVQATVARNLTVTGMKVELKAGTSYSESNAPGTARFDNVRVSKGSNAPPSVSITTPLNGASILIPSMITVLATASDRDGNVSRVSFFLNGVLLGVANTPPYQVNWAPSTSGSFTLTATAVDNQGSSMTASPVSVRVAPSCSYDISPSGVQISASPSNGSFAVTAASGCSWQATTQAGWIAVSGSTSGSGTVTFTSQANAGSTSRSATITLGAQVFAVTQDAAPPPSNVAPNVGIASPTAGIVFTSPSNVSLTANASDSDGTVTKVDFFVNGGLVGTSSTAPYATSWMATTPGTYVVASRATDNGGAASTSGGVSVTVGPPSAPTPVTSPAFDDKLDSGSALASWA